MNGYPLLLDVTGRRVLVVGGGPVAARRVRGLLDAGADVHVVAPFVCEDVWDAAERGDLTLHLREFTSSDLDETWLVHSATGERSTDDTVSTEAATRRLWCVRADDAAAGTAWTPAVARVGDVVVAVNAGADPRRAARLRNAIATELDTGASATSSAATAGGRRPVTSPWSVVAPATPASSPPGGAPCSPRPTSSSSTGSPRRGCSTTSTPTWR